jgi:hypothetical protein
VALSAVFAAAIGFVPAVFVATPAMATAGGVDFDSDIEAGEGEAFTFELRREAESPDPLTLSYTTVDRTAEAGKDYTAITGTTSFPAHSSRAVVKRFTVQGIQDALDEDDESFALKFTGTVNGSPVTITAEGILDDDDNPPTYSLSVSNPVGEGAGNARVTATLSAVSGRDVIIPVSTSPGTATAGDDYTTTSTNITVHAGHTTEYVDIPILDDPYDEEDLETFTVTGLTGSNNVQRTGAVTTVQIADNDVLPTIDMADAGAATEGGDLTFPVTLSAPSNRTVTVVANTVAGTATSNVDYTAVNTQTVTFAPGDTSEDVVVHTLGDSLNEVATETLSVELSSPTLGSPGMMTAQGGITDDDSPPVVSLTPTTVTEGNSGDQAKTFTVSLDAPAGRPIRVGYHVTSGTATAGQDFVAPADAELLFAPGDTTHTFTVDVTGDRVDEPAETFNITLSNPGATASGAALAANPITITDDDARPAIDTLPDITMDEGDGTGTATFHVALTNPSAQPITLDVSSANDTAVFDGTGPGSEDFNQPATTVTIPAGQLGADVPVQINGDAVYEGDEAAIITVATQAADANVDLGSKSATLTLTNDDDAPTVQLNTVSGAESDTVPVTASVTGVSQNPIPITVTAAGAANSGGSDAAQPEDFDDTDLNVTAIPGGTIAGPVSLGTIDLLDDLLDESPQTVEVSATYLTAVTPSFITITDDPDDMLPTVTPGNAAAGESDGTVNVPITLDFAANGNLATATEQTITAHYATADGTAKQPGDYPTETGTVTFLPGDADETVVVPIASDNIYEGTETFTVQLSTPSPALTPIAAAPSTVTITDDDSGSKPGFTLSAPAGPVGEDDGTVDFTLQLSSTTQTDVDFAVVLDDDTAKHGYATPGNDDFGTPTATVTVSAGHDSVTIPVTVKDDAVYEPTEQANLRVALADGETDAVGSQKTAVLEILDDDPVPTVALSTVASAEGTSVTVNGTVTGVAQNDLPVTLAAAGASDPLGDAAKEGDFDASGLGSTLIPGGNHSGPVALGTIAFLDDVVDENDETIRVTMTGLGNTTAPAWQTITDDPMDMSPEVSVGNVTVGESDGTAHVPVTLDFDQIGNAATSTEKTVSVGYTTGDGTAKAPGDYTTATSAVTFQPGQTSKNIDVTIAGDNVYERDETFTVTLSSPAPAGVTIADDSATVGITDDDGTNKPGFSVAGVPFTEGASGTANFTVQLSSTTREDVDFVVALDDGTAKHGYPTPGNDDFVLPATTITVPAGQDSITIPVTVKNDAVFEPTETASLRVARANGEDDAVGSEKTAVLTIADDDPIPTVALSTVASAEGTSVPVTGTVTGVAQNDVLVTLTATGTVNGASDPADDGDFGASGLSTATITGGTHSGPVTLGSIAFLDDDIDENDETVQVTMTGLGTTTPAWQTITDDVADLPPTVSVADVDVSESVGTTHVPVTLQFDQQGNDASSTEKTVSVDYATGDGTARTPGDYTASTAGANLSFSPGQTAKNINVPIVNDAVYERDENFTVTLSSPAPAGVTIEDGTAIVGIADNDSAARPTFTVADIAATEGSGTGAADFTVQLSAVTTQPVTFDVAMEDNTATHGLSSAGGDDYLPPATTTVTVEAGQSSVTVPVTVKNDGVYEGTETADLTVALADGEDDATGTDRSAQLSIADDEAVPTIVLNTQSGTEGSDLSVNATVTGSAQRDMTFALSLSGDDSNGNNPAEESDYTDNGDPGVILGGTQSGRTIRLATIPLNQDEIDEPVETIAVAAQDVNEVVTPASTSYRINDDPGDLPPSVSIGDKSIGEGGESVDLTVSLVFDNGATSTEQDVTVPWSTKDGTAKAGLDYTATSDTLTIPAAAESGTVNVPILQDHVFENDQSFTVNLGTPGPKGAGVDKGVGEVVIEDDDQPSAPTLLAPSSRPGSGTVVLTGTSGEGIRVELWAAPVSSPDSFALVGVTNADSVGAYSFAKTISVGTIYYTKANTVSSPKRTIQVVQVPTIAGSSTAKGAATLTVTGNPAAAGQNVTIQRYLGDNAWTNIATGKLGTAGTFATTNKGLKSGSTYTFRAVVASTPGLGILGGTTDRRLVTIR